MDLHLERIQLHTYIGWIVAEYNSPAVRQRLAKCLTASLDDSPDVVQLPSSSSERKTYRLALPNIGDVYLKRYYVVHWKSRLQSWFRVYKAQKAWRVAHTLLRKGIDTPVPIAYLARRGGSEHVLITRSVNAMTLAALVRQFLPPETTRSVETIQRKRALIHAVAQFLGHVHEAGVYHGDFNANNILVEETSSDAFRIVLIDLDAIRSTVRISDRRALKNLDELGRNFLNLKVFSTPDRVRFVQSYIRANAREPRAWPERFRQIVRRTRIRLQKYGISFV